MVIGVDDYEIDGDVIYTVEIAVSSSDDASYAVLEPVVLQLVNRDNDTFSGTLIAWTDRVGVMVEDGALIKTAVTIGWDSGAASVQSIPGDGAVEFTAVVTDVHRGLGLSNSNASASYDTIGYAIYAGHNGTLQVYENGVMAGDFGTYQIGDVLRIERTGNTVVYKRNGVILHTSAVASTGDLIADAALYDPGSRLDNARIIGSN